MHAFTAKEYYIKSTKKTFQHRTYSYILAVKRIKIEHIILATLWIHASWPKGYKKDIVSHLWCNCFYLFLQPANRREVISDLFNYS